MIVVVFATDGSNSRSIACIYASYGSALVNGHTEAYSSAFNLLFGCEQSARLIIQNGSEVAEFSPGERCSHNQEEQRQNGSKILYHSITHIRRLDVTLRLHTLATRCTQHGIDDGYT